MNHNTQGNEISGFIIHQQKEISLRNFIRKANLTCESLLPRSTMDATSDATFSWASFWMAIPTSAKAKEGASFIPSPTFKNLTVSCVWFSPVIILTSMCWQNRHPKNFERSLSLFPSPTFKNLTVSCVWFPPVIILTSMCWQNRHLKNFERSLSLFLILPAVCLYNK